MKIWRVILAATVIFLAGVVAGTFVGRKGRLQAEPPKPGPIGNPLVQMGGSNRREFMQGLNAHVSLTQEQTEEIERLVRRSQDKVKELWDPIAPKAREEAKNLREAILKELTPEQRVKFEAATERRHRDKKKGHDGKGDSKGGDSERKRKESDNYEGNRDERKKER